MEVNSIELVEAYDAGGFGIGISVTVPGRKPPPGLRALPLRDFPLIEIGMLWRKHPSGVVFALMQGLRDAARAMRQELR